MVTPELMIKHGWLPIQIEDERVPRLLMIYDIVYKLHSLLHFKCAICAVHVLPLVHNGLPHASIDSYIIHPEQSLLNFLYNVIRAKLDALVHGSLPCYFRPSQYYSLCLHHCRLCGLSLHSVFHELLTC